MDSYIAYKKNQMSTDRESGRGNKRLSHLSRMVAKFILNCEIMDFYLWIHGAIPAQ
jgi:hypothetical protein